MQSTINRSAGPAPPISVCRTQEGGGPGQRLAWHSPPGIGRLCGWFRVFSQSNEPRLCIESMRPLCFAGERGAQGACKKGRPAAGGTGKKNGGMPGAHHRANDIAYRAACGAFSPTPPLRPNPACLRAAPVSQPAAAGCGSLPASTSQSAGTAGSTSQASAPAGQSMSLGGDGACPPFG